MTEQTVDFDPYKKTSRIFRDKAGDRWLYAEDLVCLLDERDMLRVQLSNERKVSDMMAKARVSRGSFVPTPTKPGDKNGT